MKEKANEAEIRAKNAEKALKEEWIKAERRIQQFESSLREKAAQQMFHAEQRAEVLLKRMKDDNQKNSTSSQEIHRSSTAMMTGTHSNYKRRNGEAPSEVVRTILMQPADLTSCRRLHLFWDLDRTRLRKLMRCICHQAQHTEDKAMECVFYFSKPRPPDSVL